MAPDDTIEMPNQPASDRILPTPEAGRRDNVVGRHFIASLEIASFRTLLLSNTIAFMAMQAEVVARGYLAYSLTNSAIALGVVQLAWGAPTLALGLFGGALADRIDRRSLMMVTQLLSCISAGAIAIMVVSERVEVWHLVGVGLVQGVVFAFQMPARQSVIPELVGRSRLTNAIALNTVGNNLSRIIGPAAAGALIGATWFGMSNTYFLIAGLYAAAMILTCLLPALPSLSKERGSFLASITSALAYLRGSRVLLLLMGLAFIPTTIGMPYQTLLPVFSDRSLGLGAEGLGQLYAANGAGALVGSLLVASLRTVEGRVRTLLVLAGIFGIALAALGFSRDFLLAVTLLFLVGLFLQSFLTINYALVMTNTPTQLYGRIMSIYLLSWAILPLATFPISALVDAIGVSFTFALCGSLVAVFSLGVFVWKPVGRGKSATEA